MMAPNVGMLDLTRGFLLNTSYRSVRDPASWAGDQIFRRLVVNAGQDLALSGFTRASYLECVSFFYTAIVH